MNFDAASTNLHDVLILQRFSFVKIAGIWIVMTWYLLLASGQE
jgi:hypothetical protein